MRKPPSRPAVPAPPEPEPGALDGRLLEAELERRRKRALGDGFRQRVEARAKAAGEDPYALLAQGIRKLLRDG